MFSLLSPSMLRYIILNSVWWCLSKLFPFSLRVDMTAKCATHLLKDNPAEADDFGPHARIAEAISTLIKTEEGGKAIALTGSWGSGKSTVVKLLEKKLGEVDKETTRTFLFDAWAHQGDPLRRSFLEIFINFLCDNDWTTKDKWEPDLERISQRKGKTSTTTKSEFSLHGKVAASFLPSIPIGIAFFTKFDAEKDFWGVCGETLGWIGLLLILAPFILGFGAWVITSIFRWWNNKSRDPLLDIFIKETVINTEASTISNPDPTSIEFKDIFKRVLIDVLVNMDRQLIIVVDNLDRLDPEDALTIWATMRTFFEIDHVHNESWQKQFWLLVPFDRSALKRLWKTTEFILKGDNSVQEIKTEQNDTLVSAFVDKTFQINFYVPTPVRTDWRDYLLKHLQEAFPENHSEDNFYVIYRLYDNLHVSKYGFPTPREIKLFVNEIGTHHRVWQDNIPLVIQATYVLLKRKMSHQEFVNQLRTENIISPLICRISEQTEEKLLEDIIALHFNVTPDKSLQVFLEQPIREALDSNDAGKLEQLGTKHGFFDALEDIIQSEAVNWANETPEKLTFLANAITDNGVDKSTHSLNKIWGILKEAIGEISKWPNLGKKDGTGISKILENQNISSLDSITSPVLQCLTNSIPFKEEKGEEEKVELVYSDAEIENWVLGSAEVLRFMSSHERSEEIKENFIVNGLPEIFWNVFKAIASNSSISGLELHFQSKLPPETIIKYIGALCSTGQFASSPAKVVNSLRESRIALPWNVLVSSLNARLQEIDLAPPEISGLTETLIVIECHGMDPNVTETLKDFCNQGFFFHQLSQSQPDKNTREAALCLFQIVLHIPIDNPAATPAHAPEGLELYNQIKAEPEKHESLIKEFTKILLEYNWTSRYVSVVKEITQLNILSGSIIRSLIQIDVNCTQLTPDIVLENHVMFENILDDNSLSDLVLNLTKRSIFEQRLENTDFHPSLASYYLYVIAHTTDEKESELIKRLIPKLQKLTVDTWGEALESKTALINLVFNLSKLGHNEIIGAPLRAAIDNLTVKGLEDPNSLKLSSGEINNISKVLTESEKITLLGIVRDKLIFTHNNNRIMMLNLYHELFIENRTLSEDSKADDVVRNVFIGILGQKDPEGYKWLEKVTQDDPGILKNSKRSTRKSFLDQIEGELSDPKVPEEIRSITKNIAITIGIDISKITEKEKLHNSDVQSNTTEESESSNEEN
jgi:hypothetical protein